MKTKRKLKKKFVIFFSVYLFLFGSFFIVNTISKFNNNVSKIGNIPVAKWNVSAVLPNGTLNIIAGNGSVNYNVSVTSISEVANSYSVVVSNLPNDVEVSIDGGSYLSPVSNRIEFANAGSFNANDVNTTNNHVLSFRSPITATEISNRSIDVDVIFKQSDIN